MEKHFDFSLREGSSMVVSGPTMCGKSTFVHALLNDKHMFSLAGLQRECIGFMGKQLMN